MSGIYVHIPFCRSKCGYCAFFSTAAISKYLPPFPEALAEEARQRNGELRSAPDTLYIGGGTPSLLSPDEIARVVTGVAEALDFDPSGLREFTIEANPDDVTPEKAEAWKALGVNRVSLGLQSLDDDELRIIGRRHSADGAVEAFGLLQSFFRNISVDLIFGLPGQTADSWLRSLRRVLDLRPQHLSAYSLSFEERTRFTLMRDRGEIAEADERLSEGMYRSLAAMTREAGMEHYEISNFALPGFRSVHNSSYWTGAPYLGLGPAASSYDGHRRRRTNHPSIAAYLRRYGENAADTDCCGEEILTDEELIEEYVLTRLRTAEGIRTADFLSRFGERELQTLMRRAGRIKQSLLRRDADGMALTEEGFFVSDEVILDLI